MDRAVTIAALATEFDLVFPDTVPGLMVEAARHAWSRCLVKDRVPGNATKRCQLEVATPADSSDDAVRSALQRLTQDVTYHLIGAQTGRLLMLHAGAVSRPDGRCAVFVAPSGTGKTTLARVASRTFGYVTDETVGIDPGTGNIHAYPKPLSIIDDPDPAGRRKVETSPDRLGLLPAHESLALGRLILLDRRAQTRGVTISPLPLLEAVAALVPESSALNKLERPLQVLARLIDDTGPVVRLTYSQAADVVPAMSDLLEGL